MRGRRPVLPVVHGAQPGAGRLRQHRGGVHLRRPGRDPRLRAEHRPPTSRRATRSGSPTPSCWRSGANHIDSLTGFNGFTRRRTGTWTVTQNEFKTIPGSLLNKALTAQVIFDNGFLLPFAPTTPNFYLIPGNNQVTVVWQPIASPRSQGDPYFAVASDPGTPAEPNLLYDPNYRQYDVEGYRIYRGRVNNSGALTLVAQFDYAGTQMNDFTGQINPVSTCAPELGVDVDCDRTASSIRLRAGQRRRGDCLRCLPAGWPVHPGQARLGVARAWSTRGRFPATSASSFLRTGHRQRRHALTSAGNGGYPPLANTGVPFGYIDREPKNNFRYFYSVTAFDVNSFQSGPSSLESPRVARPVTPSVTGSNVAAPQLVSGLYGDGRHRA